ncbi:MAG: DUF4277 domain-containing protein [Elusimicrobia bacterium]|nr:DUF4277 domain-containing protein [Elusimicrobiota bacterium]
MHISQGDAVHITHHPGPHPILAHFLQRLNLQDILRSFVGTGREWTIEHGEALAALVHNILDSPAPLYRIAEWAGPIESGAFGFTQEQKRCLNDDRIARMFDALVSERGRGIWFRSSAKAALDGQAREKHMIQAQAELGLLAQRLNRRQLRSAGQIRKAVREIVERRSVKSLLRVRLRRQIQERFKRLHRGRPGAHAPVRVVRRVVWSLEVRIDEKALRAEERTDGVFPLASNLDKKKYPKREVISIYKYQPYVEKRFSQLKTDLEVMPANQII